MKHALLLLLLIGCVAPLFGKEVLDRKIDIHFMQTPLKEALDIIAQKGGFVWSYNASIIDGHKKVTLTASAWTIRETLLTVLGSGYDFRANGNYLILKKVKPNQDKIIGYVKDPKTGARIANATVFDQKTLRATTTDSNGYYSLKVKKNADVVIAKLNFRDTLLKVSPQTPRFVNIEMQEITRDTSSKPINWNLEIQQMGYELNRFFDATLDKWHELNLRDSLERAWQVSLLPMMGTNHVLSGKVSNKWSLNLLAGYSQGVDRAEIGGIGNFTRDHVHGVQIGGAFNLNEGYTKGIQIGGIFNKTGKTLSGLQIGGAANYARRAKRGSMQIGGVANYAPEGRPALQIGGAVNMADTIQGVQIAGIVNHTRTLHGVQIGLINSTKACRCVQIGLINRVGRRWLPVVNGGWKKKKQPRQL